MNYLFRIVILILVFVTVTSCNGDNAPECFRKMGTTVAYELAVPDFTAIHVSAGIELVIVQGDTQSVIVQTGEHLKEYITATVTDSTLMLTNANNCNWVNAYKTTTITVTTPHLEKIFTATQFAVRSAGVLKFPSLYVQSGLISETASGTVTLDLDCENFTVEDNQNLYCIINGRVNNLSVNFYAGDARFDGTNLAVENVSIFHRSSNDIMVKANQKISGEIYSTGNLVLLNQPPVVDVGRVYTGKVVYK
ncbi:head GIN domain-containing protein [Flavobacterium psychrotrophum]|uniref:head GIN domain-containing protein n=1 Tax=Flavobacterium psychrotrophum TaxID=2294119 RepID=UPI000E323932|nr:head GIN domain-containing protein [Flavobacterium psychrotrophum]